MWRTPIFSWRLAVGSWRRLKKPSPLPTANCQPPTGQAGFTLAALLVILTIMMMIIAFTVPEQWSMVMGRERDRQTIFLMKQYARAIKTWQMKNGGMPTSLDQLVDARKPRVIRGNGKWPCPITGKEDDWILVPFAAVQNQTQTNPTTQFAGGAGRRNNPNAPTAGPSKLQKEASPEDYVGPFVAVRPRASGKSFITFNGADDYSEWVYTVLDLDQEINARTAMLSAK